MDALMGLGGFPLRVPTGLACPARGGWGTLDRAPAESKGRLGRLSAPLSGAPRLFSSAPPPFSCSLSSGLGLQRASTSCRASACSAVTMSAVSSFHRRSSSSIPPCSSLAAGSAGAGVVDDDSSPSPLWFPARRCRSATAAPPASGFAANLPEGRPPTPPPPPAHQCLPSCRGTPLRRAAPTPIPSASGRAPTRGGSLECCRATWKTWTRGWRRCRAACPGGAMAPQCSGETRGPPPRPTRSLSPRTLRRRCPPGRI